jgi:MFS transporter, DHA1 family, inner membrane transport protein
MVAHNLVFAPTILQSQQFFASIILQSQQFFASIILQFQQNRNITKTRAQGEQAVSEQHQHPRALWSLALGNFAIGVNALVVAGVLLPMAEGLRVTPGQIGLLVSVYALTYALISPVLVAVTGGVPRKLLILIGLGLLALGSQIGALAPDFSVVMFSRIVAAFGAALFTPTASSVAVALSAPEHRGRAIGLVFAGFTVATAFGVPLGALIGVNVGWRATFLLVTGLASLGALAVILTVPAHVKVPPPNAKALLEVLRSPVLATGLLVTVLQLVAQYSVFTFIAPILKSSLGLDGNGVTAMLLAFGVASVISNLITASNTDRFGANTVSLARPIIQRLHYRSARSQSRYMTS